VQNPTIVALFAIFLFANGAQDDVRAKVVTNDNEALVCDFSLVYRMGRKGVDLRRSVAGCSQASAVITLTDVKVSSSCGSNFTLSLIVSPSETIITKGRVEPATDCRTPAPAKAPRRRCPNGFSFVCPSFSDGSCVNSNMVSLCFSGYAPSNNSASGQKRDGPIQGSCGCFPNVAIFTEAVEVKNTGQQAVLNADTATDGSLSVFSERFLTECSCLERKAIAVALRPM